MNLNQSRRTLAIPFRAAASDAEGDGDASAPGGIEFLGNGWACRDGYAAARSSAGLLQAICNLQCPNAPPLPPLVTGNDKSTDRLFFKLS
jgi:hypothetical protein